MIQNKKKKNVKELNTYTEELEKRIVQLENIIKALNIDPQKMHDYQNVEVKRLKELK